MARARTAAAAVILAAASLAGCGLFRPAAAPQGMEKQIRNGERVSAATRARVPLATRPARHTVRQAPRKITGRQVTAVGDSVMLASALALHDVLPGIYIDAVPSRQMPAGLAIIGRLAARGELRPVVVVGLGTNYLVTPGELRKLLRLIGPQRHLVLVNTYVPDGWSKQVNATDAAFISRHRDVVLANWYATIRDRPGLLWPDEVHPELPGTWVYAHLIDRAVQDTLRVAAPPAASAPPIAGRAPAPGRPRPGS